MGKRGLRASTGVEDGDRAVGSSFSCPSKEPATVKQFGLRSAFVRTVVGRLEGNITWVIP